MILSNATLRKLDEVCDQFENEFTADSDCSIEEVLNDNEDWANRHELLSRLIPLEIELRHLGFSGATYKEYLSRFPDDAPTINSVFDDPKLTLIQRDLQQTIVSEAPDSPDLILEAGENIGKYEIIGYVGSGSYGAVYQAYDKELDRDIALKVSLAGTSADIQRALSEAKNAARIKADGIATVHDQFVLDDRLFIVQEFVHGVDLRTLLNSRSLSVRQSVTLILQLARAILRAHEQHIYHRDLKPSNIIVGRNGDATIVDFGLALRGREANQSGRALCGTPSYMSPEQVRRETGKTDASTDLWGLGVIFYELVVGCLPFQGESQSELFYNIEMADPRVPSQLNDQVSHALDQIILRCLSKLKINRYSNANQLIEALEAYLALENGSESAQLSSPVAFRGLHPFRAEDAHAYLSLAPGIRDRQGLPESIRFWKNAIENYSNTPPFGVSIVHGPSGCGKTSFLRAGLLPQLAPEIVTVFVDASAAGIERQLVNELREQFPAIPENMSLAPMISYIRDESILSEGQKLLIVLDHFEHWLARTTLDLKLELINALRQCEGHKCMTLISVRGDCLQKIDQLMQAIEVPIRQNENYRQFDFFTTEHCKHVLRMFGRATNGFESEKLNESEESFLDSATEKLEANGPVAAIDLALLVETLRNQKWNTDCISSIDGVSSRFVSFLNDKFNSRASSLRYRTHYRATQRALASLLPKQSEHGDLATSSELQSASGYENSPEKFAELTEILVQELGLVTVVSQLDEFNSNGENDTGCENYRLTHDSLAPILKKWIDAEEQRHFTSRVRNRMGEAVSLWSEIRDERYLPTWFELILFGVSTNWFNWSKQERQMMKAASIKHAGWSIASVFAITALLYVALIARQNSAAEQFAKSVPDMRLQEIPDNVETVSHLRSHLIPALEREFGSAQIATDEENPAPKQIRKLKLALALAELEDGHIDSVVEGSVISTRDSLPWLVEYLKPHKDRVFELFEPVLTANVNDASNESVRMATILAHLGDASFLLPKALSFDSQRFEDHLELLTRGDNAPRVEYLEQQARSLMNQVPKKVSDSLSALFKNLNGHINEHGGFIISLPDDQKDSVLQKAFEEGFLPVSFRPFTVENQLQIAICWRRIRDFNDLKLKDCCQIETGLTKRRFAEITKLPSGQIRDFCMYRVGNQKRYAVLFVKGLAEPIEKEVTLDLTLQQYYQLTEKYRAKKFQISRLFCELSSQGVPQLNVIWERDNKNPPQLSKAAYRHHLEFVGVKERSSGGHGYADCQIQVIDPGPLNTFHLHERLFQYEKYARPHLDNPVIEIPSNRIGRISRFARTHQRLGNLELADRVYKLIFDSSRHWKDEYQLVVYLYSILDDEERLETEIKRLKSNGVLIGSDISSEEFARLRFAVRNKSDDEAEKRFNILIQAIDKQYSNDDDIESTDKKIRSKIRANSILASKYPNNHARRDQIIDEAVGMLQMLNGENYLYMLVDEDFSSLRIRPEFKSFSYKNEMWARFCNSLNHNPNLESSMKIVARSEEESRQLLCRWLESGYSPRCLSAKFNPTNQQILSQTIVEKIKDELRPKCSDEDRQRLINVAAILAKFGRRSSYEDLAQGKYGEESRFEVAIFDFD